MYQAYVEYLFMDLALNGGLENTPLEGSVRQQRELVAGV